MTTSTGASERPGLQALTGLRFFAALGVVGYHCYCAPCEPGLPSWLGRLFGAGFTTVSLFFVLSGFILAYNYLDARGGFRGTAPDFYRARFARLYPIYLVALLVDLPLFLRSIHMASPPAGAGEVSLISAATLTLTQGWLALGRPTWNIVAWTLSVEAFFYAVFPWLGPWLGRRGSRALLAIAGGAWLLGTSIMLAPQAAAGLESGGGAALLVQGLRAFGQLPVEAIPLARLPEFVIGVSLGVLFCRRPQGVGGERVRTAGFLLTCVALGGVIVLQPGPPSSLVQAAVLVPLFSLLIVLLAGGVARQGLGLGTRVWVLLGGASYALYMTHGSLMNYALAINTRTLALPHNVVAVFVALGSVAFSVVLFRFVEEPARHWLRRAGRRPRAAASPTPGGITGA